MLSPSQAICWIVTDGTVGMENQCLGLAGALEMTPIVKRVKLRAPWKQLSPFLRKGLAYAFTKQSESLDPPFPDILIASGRSGAMAALSIKRRAWQEAKKRCFTVHIQNPVLDPSRFDLVAVPRHDDLWGANVITTRGSLHRVTPALLESEAAKFEGRFASLPHPRIAVVIGGKNAVYQFSAPEMNTLIEQLRSLSHATGAGLMITASRRTGEENLALLQEGLRDIPHVLWDGTPPNPYYAMLGLAEAIIVTADSVNMVSEACSTGKPVFVVPLPGGSEKFRRFHQTLFDDGLTRPFEGVLEKWDYQPLNDPALVASRVLRMMKSQGLLQGED